jgi:HEAT repeat protein
VTTAEVTAAVFAGASEKVTFRRILKELGSQDEATRARSAAALGAIPHELSVRALAARLGADSSAEVRKECANALTTLGRSEGLPAVERALSDTCSTVRLAAVRGVYRLGRLGSASALVRMLSDDDEGVRRRATVCIGWLGRAELADELRPLLHGASVWVRLAALQALQSLKSPAAVDDVIALLDDREDAIRREAFEALRTITGQQMCETFPVDEQGRQLLIARWRAWREAQRERSRLRAG